MSSLKRIKDIIYTFDLFSTAQILRSKKDSKSRTILGGVLSILILVFTLTMFIQKVITVFKKAEVITTILTTTSKNPPQIVLAARALPFMIAFEIYSESPGIQQNQKWSKYFDIDMYEVPSRNVYSDDQKKINLQFCTPQHWASNPQAYAQFETLKMKNWYCLPLNSSIRMQGTFTSNFTEHVMVTVGPCQRSLNPRPNCQNYSQLTNYMNLNGYLILRTHFLNAIINPSSPDQYLDYYLDSSSELVFAMGTRSRGILNFQSYQINTDDSIFLIPQVKKQSGAIVKQQFSKHVVNVDRPDFLFAVVLIYRSTQSIYIKREFMKIDYALSYVGGLFGVVFSIFTITKFYCSKVFEAYLARKLFFRQKFDEEKDKAKKEKKKLIRYNFWNYIKDIFFYFIPCNIKCCFETSLDIDHYFSQINQQLDISLLLERLKFLETAILVLFEDHELNALHLLNSYQIEIASQRRQDFIKKMRILHWQDIDLDQKKSLKNLKLKNKKLSHKCLKTDNLIFNNDNLENLDAISKRSRQSRNTYDQPLQSAFNLHRSENDLSDIIEEEAEQEEEENYQEKDKNPTKQNQNRKGNKYLISFSFLQKLAQSVKQGSEINRRVWKKLVQKAKKELKIAVAQNKQNKQLQKNENFIIEQLYKPYTVQSLHSYQNLAIFKQLVSEKRKSLDKN